MTGCWWRFQPGPASLCRSPPLNTLPFPTAAKGLHHGCSQSRASLRGGSNKLVADSSLCISWFYQPFFVFFRFMFLKTYHDKQNAKGRPSRCLTLGHSVRRYSCYGCERPLHMEKLSPAGLRREAHSHGLGVESSEPLRAAAGGGWGPEG